MKLLEMLFLEPLIKHKESWREYIPDSKLGKSLEKYKKYNKVDNLGNNKMRVLTTFLPLQVLSELNIAFGQEGRQTDL